VAANDNIPYEVTASIADLITLQDVMKEHGLGPNAAIHNRMEYLDANFDWLEKELGMVGKET